ncbi:hypothetical protein [Paenacidovorax caeni]|uniref:hypothetical protein n=1 Tax=Paenacidovorax caeni TaxID=343013 RepID=UPI000A700958|nr:hypothetical protein [Paenacidovorax caeni]
MEAFVRVMDAAIFVGCNLLSKAFKNRHLHSMHIEKCGKLLQLLLGCFLCSRGVHWPLLCAENPPHCSQPFKE